MWNNCHLKQPKKQNNKSEKYRMRAKSKTRLNTKEFVQAKLQTTQGTAGKKQRSLCFWPRKAWNCDLECLNERWVISGGTWDAVHLMKEERNNLCCPGRMWVCSRVRVPTERWNFCSSTLLLPSSPRAKHVWHRNKRHEKYSTAFLAVG